MKVASTALISAMVFGTAIGAARAEICYKLTPFIDVIRLAQVTVTDEAPNGTHTLLVGNWIGVFSKPVVGSFDVSVNPSGTRIGLHGTLHGGDCVGHSDITLDGVPGGAWHLSCDGGVPGIFNNSGTLISISCDSAGPSVARGGRTATQR
jgi:hypothetical protein